MRELTETLDYEIISEAPFHTEVMLFNKLPLVEKLKIHLLPCLFVFVNQLRQMLTKVLIMS